MAEGAVDYYDNNCLSSEWRIVSFFEKDLESADFQGKTDVDRLGETSCS